MEKKINNEFYSYLLPNENHDVLRIIFLSLALFIIVGLSWFFLGRNSSEEIVSMPNISKDKVISDNERKEIMEKPSGIAVDNSLTDAQRKALASKPSKSALNKTLTDAERQAIMEQPAIK